MGSTRLHAKCQTYRDIDQSLAEPDEEKFFDAIKAYVVTCVVACRVAKEGSSKLQDKWSDFLDDYPTVEELEGEDVFGTIRSKLTICCGMNAAPPPPPPRWWAGCGGSRRCIGREWRRWRRRCSCGSSHQCQHLQAETLGHAQELRVNFSRVSSHAIVALIRCEESHQRGGIRRVPDAAADQR